jgi:hypothetical protein
MGKYVNQKRGRARDVRMDHGEVGLRIAAVSVVTIGFEHKGRHFPVESAVIPDVLPDPTAIELTT